MRSRVAEALDRTPAFIAERFAPGARAARLARPVVNRLLPSKPVAVVVRSGPGRGLRVVIDPRREKYYWSGTYERHVQDALVRSLEPGMTFWDIGAHTGFFTFLAARLVGPQGAVLAAEPLEENRRRLERGVTLNGFGSIAIESCAVGANEGMQQFHAHASTSMGSLLPHTHGRESFLVRVCTLDGLAQGAIPDLVKIDVEQAELEVVAGGMKLLAGGSKMIVELSDPNAQAALERTLPAGRSAEFLGGKHWLLG